MKLTKKWLAKYLQSNVEINDIVDKLNQIGLEVESIIDNKLLYNAFVIAEIIEAVQHPNAEKLKICHVNDGKEVLQVVCGAPNARAGIKVVLAPLGAIIPTNQLQIKESTIRGIKSQGMLCSAAELDLGDESDGIIELKDGEIGASFAKYQGLDDVILEVSITPNRGDCASVRGIARDLSATGIGTFTDVFTDELRRDQESPIKVVLDDKDDCITYCYRYVSNIKNHGPLDSKEIEWLKAVGYDPKNKLVDISNFLMFDIGTPSHIYDADKISGNILIRKSIKDEQFQAIGGKEYVLPEGLVVIADDKRVLGLAGVIGGEFSKVTEHTKNILIEMANFDADAISKAGRILNINTDARFRFERHLDDEIVPQAMNQISNMISEHCGGEFSAITCLKGNKANVDKWIEFNVDMVKHLSGMLIDEQSILKILKSLGFVLENSMVKVPSWRFFDIISAEDLVEEVLRINGLSKVPDMPIVFDSTQLVLTKPSKSSIVRQLLLNRGMDEVISWSFASSLIVKVLKAEQGALYIKNPISIEMDVMRPTVLASFIPIVMKNLARGFNNFSLFEVGPVYNEHLNNNQTLVATGIRIGSRSEKGVHTVKSPYDFFDVKDDVLSILHELSGDINKYTIAVEAPDYYHPGRACAFKLGKNIIAYCGELHPHVIKQMDISSANIMCFEVFLDRLIEKKSTKSKIEISDYQSVERDFAFIVGQDIRAGDLIKSIKQLKIDVVDDIEIFDIYIGQGIPHGFKSIAVKVKMQPKTETFIEEKIEAIANNIVDKINKDLGGVLRV